MNICQINMIGSEVSLKYVLPLGWIYCIWYRMFKHKENSFSRIRQALQSGNDVKKHSEIEKLMGIGVKKGM